MEKESTAGGSESAFDPIEEIEEVEPEPKLDEPKLDEEPVAVAPAIPEYVGTILQEIGELKQKVAKPAEPEKPVVEDINVLKQKYPEITQDASAHYEDVFETEKDRQVMRKGGYDALTIEELAEIELQAKQKASIKAGQYFNREVRKEKRLEKLIQQATPPDPMEEKARHIASIVPEYQEYLNSPDPNIRKAGIKMAAATYDKAYGDAPAASKAPRTQPTTPPPAPAYKPPKSGRNKRSSGSINAKDEHLALARKMFPGNYATPEKAAATEKHIIETMKRRGR